jgi:hypothetical protein
VIWAGNVAKCRKQEMLTKYCKEISHVEDITEDADWAGALWKISA